MARRKNKTALERFAARFVRAVPLAVVTAGVGTVIATLIASALADHPDRHVGWIQGMVAVYYLMPPLAIVGLAVGWIVGYRSAGVYPATPWLEPPPGLVLGHYRVALLGGLLAGAAAIAMVVPTMAKVFLILDRIVGGLFPGAVQVVGALWVLCVLIGGRDVARWVSARIDGTVHKLVTHGAA